MCREFVSGRGQRPPKGTDRALQLEAIECCPRHKNPHQLTDLFGRRIACKCSYHEKVSNFFVCCAWLTSPIISSL